MSVSPTNGPVAPNRKNPLRLFRSGLAWLVSLPKTFYLFVRYGTPRIILHYSGGFGDHLLLTAVAHELRKRGQDKIWIASRHVGLFARNQDVDRVVPEDPRMLIAAKKMGVRVIVPVYAPTVPGEDRQIPPGCHIIARMCEGLGFQGELVLKPWLKLDEGELQKGVLFERQICIQSSALGGRFSYLTKEWYPDRFQSVVNQLKDEFDFIQVGSLTDPLLTGARDLRGKTTFRETAALLANSLAYVGTVGFLMHLARTVDCRSVIVYGGRELPLESGYTCNENLNTRLSCSPCWILNSCPYDRECMKAIQPEQVVAAIRRQIARQGTPLTVDRFVFSSDAAKGETAAR